jgi:hypothetical protein
MWRALQKRGLVAGGGLHEGQAVAARNLGTSETSLNFYQVIRCHKLSRSAVPFRKFSVCVSPYRRCSAWRCVRSGGPPWHKPLYSNYIPRYFPPRRPDTRASQSCEPQTYIIFRLYSKYVNLVYQATTASLHIISNPLYSFWSRRRP